ncbi:MAG TPA: response regulator transcription factor [Candidatus Deferrimicrobiaceae bacterium]|nr:response regulator transcription factor [Candidatus Deferrimicrobiaceae bacterium]
MHETAQPEIRILLVDDQPLFRRAIATLVGDQPGLVVVGEADNGVQGLEMARALKPDVVLLDVEMPVMNGVEATRRIRDEVPAAKIVILTVSEADDHLFDAIRFGAHGYLLKNLRPEQLYELIRAVMRDETVLSPAIAGRLLREFREHPEGRRVSTPSAPEPSLTAREIQIMQLVADGLSNKEIGVRLSITEGTVKNHVHNALEKLQLENRIQAAAYVVRHGLGLRVGTEG